MDYLIPSNFNNEKEVEYFYSKILTETLKCNFQARFNTDGIYDNKTIKLLAEYKKSGDLKNPLFLSKCICQIIGYIKKIENYGEKLPNIIFIGTENQFSIFESSKLKEYLDVDFDWSLQSPSYWFLNPPIKIEEILKKIPLYNINSINNIKENIKNYKPDKSDGLKININKNNVERIFEEFLNSNIVNLSLSNRKKLYVFISMIFDECQDLSKDKGKIIILVPDSNNENVKSHTIYINRSNYEMFKNTLKYVNKPKSKNIILSQKDCLIDEATRRNNGEFYTAQRWVNEAHKLIDEIVGIDWKEKYRVWDPACGTGNLTRDYKFKYLTCSTIFQEDIDLMNQRYYNPGSIKFEYDFLNTDVNTNLMGIDDSKLSINDPTLDKDIKDKKPFMFLQNSPFNSVRGFGKTNDIKLKESKVVKLMKKKQLKLNKALGDKLLVFLFQNCEIIKNNKLDGSYICAFIKLGCLTRGGFYNWRKYVYQSGFTFIKGFGFKASEFSDVKSNWGIGFVIFKYNKQDENRSINNFDDKYKIEIIDDKIKKQIIEYNGVKEIIINRPKKITLKLDDIKLPELTNGLNYTGNLKTTKKGSIGYMGRGNPNMIFVSSVWSVSGTPVIKENFLESLYIYTAINLMPYNKWIYDPIELKDPDINNPDFIQWNNDCIIYLLFNSDLSSLRNININNKIYHIKNHFFWMSKQEMEDLAKNYDFKILADDCDGDCNRFIYQLLQSINLSNDAQRLLNMAKQILRNSFKYRQQANETKHIFTDLKTSSKKELHRNLQAWDAGWYQIKQMINECIEDENIKNELKEFNIIFSKFENRLKEGLFEFNFIDKF